jgi:hypothetical protein
MLSLRVGRDEELESYVLDEDKLLDLMEPIVCGTDELGEGDVGAGGFLVDFHSSSLFPEVRLL